MSRRRHPGARAVVRAALFAVVGIAALVGATPARADSPGVVDRDALARRVDGLAALVDSLQRHAQYLATVPSGSREAAGSLAQLQAGLASAARDLQGLSADVRRAPPPVVAAAACPPPLDCVAMGYRPIPGRAAPPVLCPPCTGWHDRDDGDRDRDRANRDRDRAYRGDRYRGDRDRDRDARRPVPISDGELQAILAAVQREAFSQDKLRVLGDALSTQWLTAAQTVQILDQLPFSNDKLGALRIAAPRLVDRENAYVIYGALTFRNDKDQAHHILEP